MSFEHGDICDSDGEGDGTRYSSEIQYICNNETEEFGWPDFVGMEGKCHLKFSWRSKWACSICR